MSAASTATAFALGQVVWRASWDSEETAVECPDCGGQGRIRILLHDDTVVSVQCEGCRRGYERSTGWIRCYKRSPRATREIITGIAQTDEGFTYTTVGSYQTDGASLCLSEAPATALARVMAEQADQVERDRINEKAKPTKTWSWHVHYHRSEIRRAQKDIAHHTACLNVARVKAKEPACDAAE